MCLVETKKNSNVQNGKSNFHFNLKLKVLIFSTTAFRQQAHRSRVVFLAPNDTHTDIRNAFVHRQDHPQQIWSQVSRQTSDQFL